MGIPTSNLARLAAGLAVLVGFGDMLGVLTVVSYLHEARQSRIATESTMLAVVVLMAGPALALVLAFVAGVMAGSSTGHWAQKRRRHAVLVLVTLLFAMAAILSAIASNGPVLLVLVLAMGALHGVLEDVPAEDIGLFDSIRRLGEKLATLVAGRASRGWTNDLLRWIGLLTGIVAGMILYPLFGLASIWLAAAIAGLLTAVAQAPGRVPPY